MAYVTRQSTRTVTRGTDEARADDQIVHDTYAHTPIIARVFYLLGGIVIALLGFRFILALLGANQGNAFASFIYTASYPFVAPFYGLFNIKEQLGVVRFEFETLIAMAFWAFVTWGLVQLALIAENNNRGDV